MTSKYKGLCPVCGEDEIYSEKLINGQCLSCYNRQQTEDRLIEVECRHDYEEGLI